VARIVLRAPGATVIAWSQKHLPGVLLAVLVAAAARLVGVLLPAVVSEILVAILLGLAASNLWTPPKAAAPGLRFVVQKVLRAGIVFLGARFYLADVARIGGGAIGLILLCMTVALAFALLVGNRLRLPPRLALLIGVGTAVCGNSAIVATAPVIKADEREVGLAVGTITLTGTMALFLYPMIGHMLRLSDAAFGVWSGVAVNDTSQVVATSAAYSVVARDVATVVKLVRNALMAPLIMLIAWWWSRSTEGGSGTTEGSWLKAIPPFVLMFLGMALLRSVGLIPAGLLRPLDEAAKACILVAMAGIGLQTKLQDMRAVGASPFFLGVGTAALLATLSLLAIVALGMASTIRP
jgi:uncharacterized integral membrane protein (TIGR00698 family)